jgi:hypothetical protein
LTLILDVPDRDGQRSGGAVVIPVTDEQAKAVAKLSDFGTTVVTAAGDLARCIGRILGTVPEDAVGFVLGDPLHAVRTLAAQWYDDKVQRIHERRGVKQTQPVSPSVAIPLIRGAYDETREGLRDMWAELIAAAMDPKRSDRVRISFVETLRQFDPLDALLLKTISVVAIDANGIASNIAAHLNRTPDDIVISLQSLHALKCITDMGAGTISAYGRGLLRACDD